MKMPKGLRWLKGQLIIEVYKARDGWRWRMWSRNGRIVADGSEAYTRRDSAMKGAKRLDLADVVVAA